MYLKNGIISFFNIVSKITKFVKKMKNIIESKKIENLNLY